MPKKKSTRKNKEPTEQPPKEKKNVSILDQARNQRHNYLKEKIKDGIGLNASERNELAELERVGNMPPGCVATQKDLAEAMGVGYRIISHWIKQGMPKTPEGFYDLLAIKDWHYQNIGEGKNKKKESDGKNWEGEYRKFKAQQAEIELQKIRGELLSIEDVEQGRVMRIQTLKNALLSLPSRLAPRLEGLNRQELRVELSKALHEMMRHFSGQTDEEQ